MKIGVTTPSLHLLPVLGAVVPWPHLLDAETLTLQPEVAKLALALLIPLWLLMLVRFIRYGYIFGPAPASQDPRTHARQPVASVPPAWAAMIYTQPAARAHRERTPKDRL